MKVKATSFVFNRDPRKPSVNHVAIVDHKGRVWERFSDDEPGKWSEIPLPDEPNRTGNRRRGASKPAR